MSLKTLAGLFVRLTKLIQSLGNHKQKASAINTRTHPGGVPPIVLADPWVITGRRSLHNPASRSLSSLATRQRWSLNKRAWVLVVDNPSSSMSQML